MEFELWDRRMSCDSCVYEMKFNFLKFTGEA